MDGSGKAAVGRLSSAGAAVTGVERLRRGRRRLEEEQAGEADGKMVDGSLLGDANGVDPAPGRVKDSGKWQKPRFSRKALMKCCLVKWIIASTQPQDKGETRQKQT
ncbi:hypothetical protein CHARACLAT_023108 [Characodon lateralis]|uniref:Uncharacterized protein n=1 Tax=Characodon lateralis TaxID=208331 RepID=A0ABU7E477_9TELE|nr:hypothetical protein [Characodon lateralis]